MEKFIIIILSTIIVSLGAFVGLVTLLIGKQFLQRFLISLVAISAGTLLGGTFLHLIPEANKNLAIDKIGIVIIGSFVFFFLLEKLLHWRHCHKGDCDIHAFGFLNLIGDALHNFIDGVIIAAAYLTDNHLGLITTIAVAFHEIPQEIGDLAVLLYAGFSKKRAFWANTLVALTAVIGGGLGFFLARNVTQILPYLLALAAGGFLYISTSDLIPEIRKENKNSSSLPSFFFLLLGIFIMWLLKLWGD